MSAVTRATSNDKPVMVLRYNQVTGLVIVALGAVCFGASMYLKPPRYAHTHGALVTAAVIFGVIGVVMACGLRCVSIRPNSVHVKMLGIIPRHFSVEGIDDLTMTGTYLVRRSDGQRLSDVSKIKCNGSDVKALRSMLASAQAPAA